MSNGTLTPPVGPEDHVQGLGTRPGDARRVWGFRVSPLRPGASPSCSSCSVSSATRSGSCSGIFPLREAHPHAEHAAEAAESAAARGGDEAFWEMHDLLFENQEALDDESLLAYAEAAGVDPTAVAADLAAGATAGRVHRDFRSGVRSGVNGTPTFFVNGRRYDGNWIDAESFAADLQALVRTPASR